MESMETSRPLIIAHRGASAYYPENSMPSLQAAFNEFNADMIEFDVRPTKDGVPVVMHDPRLERTTTGKGPVNRRNYSALKEIHIRGNARFAEKERLKIPTLEEVLKAFPHGSFAIEIKEHSERFVHDVLALLERHQAASRSIVGSKLHNVSKILRSSAPELRRFSSRYDVISLLYEFLGMKKKTLPDPLMVAALPLQTIGIRFDSKKWIDFLHTKGIVCFFWTINDAEIAKRLISLGADGIVTDDPGMLSRLLNSGTDPKGG